MYYVDTNSREMYSNNNILIINFCPQVCYSTNLYTPYCLHCVAEYLLLNIHSWSVYIYTVQAHIDIIAIP